MRMRNAVLAVPEPRPAELRGRQAVIACEGDCKALDAKGMPRDVFTKHEFLRRESPLGNYILDGQQACVRHIYRCKICRGSRVYGCE